MSELSLMTIIGNDPDFGRRIAKKVEEIKQDKKNILAIADDYGKKYQQEVLEGTERRGRMLTEGAARGLSEEEVMRSYGRFLPSIYTPILNLLYFLLRESECDPYYGNGHNNETLDQFEILKKLKALAQSDNIEEATMAFKKGKELSKKYGLDWERIPCYYKKK